MKERIICIEWDDAAYDSGYYDRNDAERYQQLKTITVGHLIKSSPKEILIGTDKWRNRGAPTDYRHITTIPKKMIISIKELKNA